MIFDFESFFDGLGMLMLYALMAIALFLFLVITHIVGAIPVYKIAKKNNVDHAWFAWVPVIGGILRSYLVCVMAGDKEFRFFDGELFFKKDNIPELFDKTLVFKNRKISFLIYVAIGVLLNPIISVLVVGFYMFPVIGVVLGGLMSILYVVTPILTIAFDYVYFRDFLYLYKEDKKTVNMIALIVSILDGVVAFGFAKVIYLYTLMNKEPLEKVLEIEAVPQEVAE